MHHRPHIKEANFKKADLNAIILVDEKQIGPQLADTNWENVNLTVVNWLQIKILEDEHRARQKRHAEKYSLDEWQNFDPTVGKFIKNWKKDTDTRLHDYRRAVRANQQLAVVLRAQGLNEEGDHFAYRANVLQRKVYWYQIFLKQEREKENEPWYVILWGWSINVLQRMRKFVAYAFSLLLDWLAMDIVLLELFSGIYSLFLDSHGATTKLGPIITLSA